MAITKSTSFDNNKLKDITFVDIFSEEYKDKYQIHEFFGNFVFDSFYDMTFDEAMDNYFYGNFDTYGVNLFFSIIKYCLDNSKVIGTESGIETPEYTSEQINFLLSALCDGFDFRDCYVDDDMDKMIKVFNVMKVNENLVKYYLSHDGSAYALHHAILDNKNLDPLIYPQFWNKTDDGVHFTQAMYKRGFDIRKDKERNICLFKDGKYLCNIDESLIDMVYIEFISGLPVDRIVHCIESRANTSVIECYEHLLKFYNIPVDDLKYIDREDLGNLMRLEGDRIGKYIRNLLVETEKKHDAIKNLDNYINN